MSSRLPSPWSFDLDGVAVNVTPKQVKHLRLRVVPPHGDVRVSAPLSVSRDEVRGFVRERRPWLLRARRDVVARSGRRALPLAAGGLVSLWGQPYPAVVTVGARESARLVAGEIRIVATEPARAEVVLDRLYRQELEAAIEPLRARWEDAVGRSAETVRFRRMKTRWGSCNPVRRSITLNLALAQFAPEYLEYVLIHELVHLWERGHGEAFRGRMQALLPRWRILRGELAQYQP
ncbi:MAG TPA: SprT family zinc-dependent metalloprotease [Arachnia sp.]|nr:SprT family zinc-dependent metalloprotease [Arachnia sp.]HMT85504.1 SprT family zinc-dependent metalloprotease [Arachnia sp.]